MSIDKKYVDILAVDITPPHRFLGVKRVPGRGPEQRESGKTVLYALIIIIIILLISYIIYYY